MFVAEATYALKLDGVTYAFVSGTEAAWIVANTDTNATFIRI